MQMYQRLRRALARLQSQKGFTLVELLIVVAILGILAGIVTVSLVGLTGTASKQSCIQEKSTLQSAIDAYMANNNIQSVTAVTTSTNSPGSVTLDAKYGTLTTPIAPNTAIFLRGSGGTQFYWTWTTSGAVASDTTKNPSGC